MPELPVNEDMKGLTPVPALPAIAPVGVPMPPGMEALGGPEKMDAAELVTLGDGSEKLLREPRAGSSAPDVLGVEAKAPLSCDSESMGPCFGDAGGCTASEKTEAAPGEVGRRNFAARGSSSGGTPWTGAP